MEVRIWKMISLSCLFLFTLSPPLSEYLYMSPDICAPILKTTGLGEPCKGGDSVANGRNIHNRGQRTMVFFLTSCRIFCHLLLLLFPSSLIFLPHSVRSSLYLKNGTKLGQYLSVCHSTELLLPCSRLSFWAFVARQKYREIVS